MNLIRAATELTPDGRPVCGAIGMFDGVHLGHQRVLRQAIDDARDQNGRAVAITFDRHPNAVVAPHRAPLLIDPLSRRLRLLEALALDTILLLTFDVAFSQVPGEAFIRSLVREFGTVGSLCVGARFAFGHRRSGDVGLLRVLGTELGFIVHALPAATFAGHAVSSTRIREAVKVGEFEAARQMLGRPYALCGRVVRGDRVGTTLGFPTANVEAKGLVLPPNGVYAARALARGSSWPAAVNIGLRPTREQAQPQVQVEAHLLGFTADLYDQEIELAFVRQLRTEQRFPSLDALREQIGLDVEAARAAAG